MYSIPSGAMNRASSGTSGRSSADNSCGRSLHACSTCVHIVPPVVVVISASHALRTPIRQRTHSPVPSTYADDAVERGLVGHGLEVVFEVQLARTQRLRLRHPPPPGPSRSLSLSL